MALFITIVRGCVAIDYYRIGFVAVHSSIRFIIYELHRERETARRKQRNDLRRTRNIFTCCLLSEVNSVKALISRSLRLLFGDKEGTQLHMCVRVKEYVRRRE